MFEAKNKTAAVVVITQATAGAIEDWWVIKAIDPKPAVRASLGALQARLLSRI